MITGNGAYVVLSADGHAGASVDAHPRVPRPEVPRRLRRLAHHVAQPVPPPSPADYEHRRAGIHAHNRWLAEFCADAPGRRAGCGQIFLNDLDDAIEDLAWIVSHGLRAA